MASQTSIHQRTFEAQRAIPYKFRDLSLLQRALIAGDSNSDDREGNQVGYILTSRSRLQLANDDDLAEEQQEIASLCTSKKVCSMLAIRHRLHQMIRISERQEDIGPQPTHLKNALAAIIAAVWLDSRDYYAIARVMTRLGFVNYAEPLNNTQNQNLTGSVPSASSASRNPDGELVEWNAPVRDTHRSSDYLAVDSLEDIDTAVEFTQFDMRHIEEALEYQSRITRNDLTSAASEATTEPGPLAFETSSTNHYTSTFHQEPGVYRPSISEVNSTVNLPKAHAGRRKHLGSSSDKDHSRRRNSQIRLFFKAYISREAEKLRQQPELISPNYGHMMEYQEALSAIETSHKETVAKLAVAIGDCSAMLLLKKAIESTRCPPASGSLYVGRSMSTQERFEAIERLDQRMAHLRLTRWLHIHRLVEDLSQEVGGRDIDDFVVLTNADLDQRQHKARPPVQRGNPRNLEQAMITRMIGDVGLNNNEGGEHRIALSSLKRVRRVGQRLQRMVHRWHIGSLALLGAGITDDQILSLKDTEFNSFLDVVERFEGPKIRSTSAAAAAAIELFLDDGAAAVRLQIEDTEDKDLETLPRLSQSMQALFSIVGSV